MTALNVRHDFGVCNGLNDRLALSTGRTHPPYVFSDSPPGHSGSTETHRVLYVAAKARILLEELVTVSKEAPLLMLGGALVQSLFGVARLAILMAPLRIIFLKISGVQTIHIPKTSASVSVDLLLVLAAAVLIAVQYALAALDFFIDAKRRKYAETIRNNGDARTAKNIQPFHSILKSILSVSAILPIILYMDFKFTLIICLIIFAIVPLFIASRRFSAQEHKNDFLNAAINSRTTGSLSIGVLVAAALMHIASVDQISHEAAVYFLIYFMLIRQLAVAVQRAADGFHKIRL